MSHRPRIVILWLLTGLFAARVHGQVMVGRYSPNWLPQWSQWYSGLLPYPALLACQLALLMFMAVVNTDNSRQSGPFHVESPKARLRLRGCALVYAVGMLLRYAIRMGAVPEARWFGGSIPIVFHLVLAGWIAALSSKR